MAGNKPFNKQPEPRDFKVEGMKVPPHSIEAEQSVLGGLMLDNERWDDVAERVVAEDFYTRPHRHIFTEMHRLQEMSKPIDLITLAESLEQQGQLDSVGGFAYLAELSKNTPSAANISAYADIVRERALVVFDSGYDTACVIAGSLDLSTVRAARDLSTAEHGADDAACR